MTDLLDNELIRKYFTSEFKAYYPVMDKTHQMDAEAWDRCQMAALVLRAMSEPIKYGERRLYVYGMQAVWDGSDGEADCHSDFHPNFLRLPDRFQAAGTRCEHRHELGGCHKILGCPPNAWDGDKPEPCGCMEMQGRIHSGRCDQRPVDTTKRDMVEDKIRQILEAEREWLRDRLAYRLRELVTLARKRS